MNVLAILQKLLELALTPGGQGALEKFFIDHGISAVQLDIEVKNLKDAPLPKE